MAPSQLKRLKSSLREQGVVGPQKSKKQKKQASNNGAWKDSGIQRSTVLQGIREQFNPFEVKAPSRQKHEFASNRIDGNKAGKGAISRPGVTKGLGEENVGFDSSAVSATANRTRHSAGKLCLSKCSAERKLEVY